MRTTTHVGRKGKGGVKHNFREYDFSKAKNIHMDRMSDDLFLINYFERDVGVYNINQLAGLAYANQNVFSKLMDRYGDNPNFSKLTAMQKIELAQYEKFLSDSINAQNDRYRSKGQYKYCKDVVDVLLSSRTKPTETILQIGDRNEHVSVSTLWSVYTDYFQKHNDRFGDNIKILNVTLHGEESTPHAHERKLFLGLNEHGEVVVSKTEALKCLGIEAPHPDQKQDRYNNRLMTYTAMCRDLWIETCREHGIEVETVPSNPQQHGLDLAEYKAACEEKKLYAAQEQLTALESDLKNQQQELSKLNSAVTDKFKFIGALNNRIEELEDKYTDEYQQFDIALQVAELLQQEDPDYFNELQNRLDSPVSELYTDDNLEL